MTAVRTFISIYYRIITDLDIVLSLEREVKSITAFNVKDELINLSLLIDRASLGMR
jgi:hypothetical protein